MHRHIVASVLALLLITPVQPHAVGLLPRIPPPQSQSQSQQAPASSSSSPSPSSPSASPSQQCPALDAPRSFALREITYLHYEVTPDAASPQPGTTQLVFEVTNRATGVSTGCACQTVVATTTAATTQCSCVDRTITGGAGGDAYPVTTRARVDWDRWRLAVNQTWSCDGRRTINQSSTLTLVPTCTENRTGSQYIKECTALDVVVAANFT
ncbi:hypothetical protein F4802DRAFT_204182 [Xylaria palmicola]|nr:hypothetical protein F4802DRAFT_204182 [Xylaria palmicola]